MGVRQKIAQKPALTVCIIASLLIASTVWAVHILRPERLAPQSKAYFTDDDGKTTFVDKITQIPPFDHNGKVAVRAYVFTIDDHATSFVGYLQRYKANTVKLLQASQSAVAGGKPPTVDPNVPGIAMGGTEFKRPGDPKWLSSSDLPAKEAMIKNMAPSGKVLDSVEP